MTSKYEVGQRVWIYDVNARGRGPDEGRVVNVGRTLVQVEQARYPGHWWAYRIETGVRNDDYGHSCIRNDAERAELEARLQVTARLRECGWRDPSNRYSIPTLTKVADLLEAEGGA